MQLAQFLDFEAVRGDLAAGNKRQLLNQLAQIAAARLSFDPSAIADAIGERERLGSTGLGGGVAIPHGKLAGIDRVYALVARLAAPMDYKAVDGQPVDLVFLLLSPPDGFLVGSGGLQLADKLAGGKAALWCLCMISLSTILAFFAGRLGTTWHRAELMLRVAAA